MTLVSYAQNFEDVMLARALADVDVGFYVDVGAQDPVIDSVTRLFYERGWNGINIEPVSHWFERLQADRPRDINLMCAVAASEGTLVLHEFPDSGLSTASEAYARNHADAGRKMVKRIVPTVRLDEILARHAPGDVHFLKVDVEGMEQEVLAGLSLQRHRPWILIIEATEPNSTVDVSQVWEPSVLAAGYRLVYRDGLNRFYLAEEQMSRASAFDIPPNVFDDFIPYREHAGNVYARSLETRLQALHDGAEDLRRDLATVTDTAMARQKRLEELDAALAQRQSMLEERARAAEAYRVDLLVVAETAERRQCRIGEMEATLGDREAALGRLEAAAETARLRAQLEMNLVAEAAENRRVLIAELEVRLGQGQEELRKSQKAMRAAYVRSEGLREEIERIHASRSWRLTVPLRVANQSARSVAGRILRAAAASPLLRSIGRRLLAGRIRLRVLSLAGFRPEVEAGLEAIPVTESLDPEAGKVELTRAGARVYGLLTMASGRNAPGRK